MNTKTSLLRASLALTICLLTASCADFFQTTKPAAKAPADSNNQNSETGTGTLPGDFQKPNEGPFTEEKMLINIGTHVVARSVESFAATVPVLKNSLRQYCEGLSQGVNSRRAEAQAQMDWERSMLAFHELEAAPFGPLIDEGRALNDFLYSWPYLNTCDIDKKAYENSQASVEASSLLFNVRGLGAIEYLLFEKTLKSSCNLRAHPAMRTWNALPDTQKKLHRCLWAQELIKDVEVKSTELNNRWSLNRGNFTKALIDGSRYSSIKEAINGLTDALGYVEKLKDTKLGRPLGRSKECSEDKCSQDVEHRYSGLSLAAAEAHLKGFKAIFNGSYGNQTGYGLDDLLATAGRADVAERVNAALNTALNSLRAAQERGSLYDQAEAMSPALCKSTTATDRKEEICAVHADVREVAFLLKTEVLAALALRAPPTHQGDND